MEIEGSPYSKKAENGSSEGIRVTKKTVLIAFALVVVSVAFYFWWFSGKTHYFPAGDSAIVIKGDRRFVELTEEALAFMNETSPYYYNYSVFYMETIQQTKGQSGISQFNQTRLYNTDHLEPGSFPEETIFMVSDDYVRTDDTGWYAYAIIHDSCHIEQFMTGRWNKMTAEEKERECLEKSVPFLVEIGRVRPETVDSYIERKMKTRWWEDQFK